jgi:hypothetical protein
MRSGLLTVLCLTLLLCACGKRAVTVDAPEGADPKAFPQTYPDIKLDPAGTYKP